MATSARVQPLNQRTIKAGVKAAAQYVQDEKIEISRKTITKFQYAERWTEDYVAFVASERRNNLYKDPDKFFRVMHSKPEWYARKFIFRPIGGNMELVKLAGLLALRIVIEQARRYGTESGHYASSFQIGVNHRPATSLEDLNNLDPTDAVTLVNTAAYASTIEWRAIEFNKMEGIIYYAAQVVRRRYPTLAVRQVYLKSNTLAAHKYSVPSLAIGLRGSVIEKSVKPGVNNRKEKRRTARAAAKTRSKAQQVSAREAAAKAGRLIY